MKRKLKTLPPVRPGEVMGTPHGWTAEEEFEHYIRCPGCGEWVDMRDLGMALMHARELPHGPGIKMH
jgi:hypothetical protein